MFGKIIGLIESAKLISALAVVLTFYLPLATWLKYSYAHHSPTVKGSMSVIFERPFEVDGHAFTVRIKHWLPHSVSFAGLADDELDNERSRILLYEDGVLIGPAHASYADIRDLGMGRFSHWAKQGFIFSSSDNSDVNTNGRQYWAVLP
jgi:hypothetical protein